MKFAFCLLLLAVCLPCRADWLTAMQAYESSKFEQAEQEFLKLLTVGNADAVFNLGVMAYNGEGQQTNLPLAAAYFKLAGELKHADATRFYGIASKQLAAEQQTLLQQQYSKLRSAVFFIDYAESKKNQTIQEGSKPKALSRAAPEYPKTALYESQFGYVAVRLLVDGAGVVQSVDVMDSYPDNVFDEVSITAVKQWRYEATGKFHVVKAQLDFSMGDGVKHTFVERWLKSSKLWPLAVDGSPAHQEALGTVLQVLAMQSGKDINYITAAEPEPETVPTFKKLRSEADYNLFVENFRGKVAVMLDNWGTVREILDDSQLTSPAAEELLGQRVKHRGKMTAGQYTLRQTFGHNTDKISVEQAVDVPETLSGLYWWHKSAKNGYVQAQRNLAVHYNSWHEYLLQQQDPVVMAWAGVDLLLEGEKDQGLALLDKAIALNYPQATELKKQLM